MIIFKICRNQRKFTGVAQRYLARRIASKYASSHSMHHIALLILPHRHGLFHNVSDNTLIRSKNGIFAHKCATPCQNIRSKPSRISLMQTSLTAHSQPPISSQKRQRTPPRVRGRISLSFISLMYNLNT